MNSPHLIWDWNGTLLDDTDAAIETLNIMIGRRGGSPLAVAALHGIMENG